ncbi:Golgi-associated plant pathoproteinsis- protein 1 [Bulinus truncatus]|nr:Golgi-associated plant pathoproteinsis- protein 1 [Bulinus truncatus]
MNPPRSLSASDIRVRERRHRYEDGIENRCCSWYTYRDGTGRNLIRQTTVTTAHNGPVTYTTRLRLLVIKNTNNRTPVTEHLYQNTRIGYLLTEDMGAAADESKVVGEEENTSKKFRQDALTAHNNRRAKHGSPALKLSEDLNQYAQSWAEHLIKTKTFSHSKCMLNGARIGENIANKWATGGADFSGEEATEMWYSEIKDHNYTIENNPKSGHFTQVVWKSTTEMGIGKAKSSEGSVIVVGSYRPPGNMLGAFGQNVLPPK